MKQRRRRNVGWFSSITSGISTALVLILLGIVFFFVAVAHNFGRTLRENFAVEVILSDSITKKEAYTLQQELRALPWVRYTNYVSKERGTQEMAEALKGSPTEFLGSSPIPAEFEVYLEADYANKDSLAKFLPYVSSRQGVTDVTYPRDAMEVVNYYLPLIGLILLIIAALLSFVSFALINNTIRMSVHSKRFTIHTMKLVGARWGYIRRPFLARAFWVGLIASLIACGLLYLGMELFRQQDVYLSQLLPALYEWLILGVVMGCGLLLTLGCAFFSVNKHLRMKGHSVYTK
ncbi:MAG: permease-like cell division protein FtsX [Bacteroidaceae bacterium]|nr:permease-like cell division protein FtsX [Bacteroidaceae bacterium]